MTISPTSGTAAGSAANAGSGSGAAGASLISSDFQTFLRMMTTQLQNQDPMNPIDSADYAVQLATFSGVEQQARTNQLLEGMRAQMGLSGLADLAAWVGREARSPAAVQVDGTPVTLSYTAASGADRAVLVAYDAEGTQVARQDVSPAAGTLDWTPLSITGAPLPAGRYTFALESYAGEDPLSETPVQHYARVTEIRAGAEGATVILQGGVEVAASAITALRD